VQQNSSKSKYDSIEQLKKLFKHGYVINHISHPPTSDLFKHGYVINHISHPPTSDLFKHGYVINHISHPPTSDATSSIMINFIQPKYREECLLIVFGEETVALSGFVKSSLLGKNEKGEILE
jgi:hypothetical protein